MQISKTLRKVSIILEKNRHLSSKIATFFIHWTKQRSKYNGKHRFLIQNLNFTKVFLTFSTAGHGRPGWAEIPSGWVARCRLGWHLGSGCDGTGVRYGRAGYWDGSLLLTTTQYSVLLSTTQCYSALHSTVQHYSTLLDTTQHYSILLSTT